MEDTGTQPEVWGGSEGGGGGVEDGVGDADPMVAQPDFLNPVEDAVADDAESPIEAQPPFFWAELLSTSMDGDTSAAAATGVDSTCGSEVVALGILIPAAAAILRSSRSSRLRSFSFRLSISSLGLSRALACMSLKRALW